MAHFPPATLIVDKIRLKIDCHYFNMETLRVYKGDKHVVWGSIKDHGDVRNGARKRLCISVSNGEAVGEVYMAHEYIKNITRGVAIRGGWHVICYPMYTIS